LETLLNMDTAIRFSERISDPNNLALEQPGAV
jgi:hypothetical protein